MQQPSNKERISKIDSKAVLFLALLVSVVACGNLQRTASNDNSLSGSKYNFAPASRTVAPVAVYRFTKAVQNPEGLLRGSVTRLSGRDSQIVIDFGKEVGGILTIEFAAASDANENVGLAFSESSLFVGRTSDASNYDGPDGALYTRVKGSGDYVIPKEKLRGGFRYVTLFMDSTGWVDIKGVSAYFTASPQMQDLRSYPNFFLSNDDLLNRIWYAGAYTVQLDTFDPRQGQAYPLPSSGWNESGVIGAGTSILADGAKRDRTVWPADMQIAQMTAFTTTGDEVSSRNALDILYVNQNVDGALPYCGPPLSLGYVSDTYHLWTLVATYDYFVNTKDKEWLDAHWRQYKAAVQFAVNKIDASGVFNVNLDRDWGRVENGGEEISANALLYRVLVKGALLAEEEKDNSVAMVYQSAALNLKLAVNRVFWDDLAGQYRDAPSSNLYPQDGNALAVLFGVTESPEQSYRISRALRRNWNAFGALTPERANAIATFPGSLEVQSHFAANDDETGLALIRLEWGYMLTSPIGTNSTFWEGYLSDGSFDYKDQGSYMSHSHGWATGPTSALTHFVLGLSPEISEQFDYTFVPHPGDLKSVSGGLTLAGGFIEASWERDESGNLTESISAPASLTARVGVPTFGRKALIRLDGEAVWNGCVLPFPQRASNGLGRASADSHYVYFDGLKGPHTLTATYSCGRQERNSLMR